MHLWIPQSPAGSSVRSAPYNIYVLFKYRLGIFTLQGVVLAVHHAFENLAPLLEKLWSGMAGFVMKIISTTEDILPEGIDLHLCLCQDFHSAS